jgi:hypothetical protein
MPRYTILINDNNQIKMLHTEFDKLKTVKQVERYLDAKYKEPRIQPMNLYGVLIPDYQLEKPDYVGVLKGHVKEKILEREED